MQPDKRIRRNSVAFFGILYTLVVFLIWKKTPWLHPLALLNGALLVAGFFATLALAPFLTPVFTAILALTRRLGTLIFGLLSLLVFFLLLTPLALIMRVSGKKFLPDPQETAETWYEEWSPGESPDKQY